VGGKDSSAANCLSCLHPERLSDCSEVRPAMRGSTVVDGDAFGKFDGVGESDFRNGLRLEGGQWVK